MVNVSSFLLWTSAGQKADGITHARTRAHAHARTHSHTSRSIDCRSIDCRSIACRSNDCRSIACRSNDCRRIDCRSIDCRSNDCRSNDCRSNDCRSIDCRINGTTPYGVIKTLQSTNMLLHFIKKPVTYIILIHVYTYVDVKKDWYRRHIRNYNTLTVRLA